MPYKDEELKRKKHKEYSRKHYEENRKKTLQRTKAKKAAERAKWYEFKSTLRCAHCGFFHMGALDFHHIDPKTKEGSVHNYISGGQFAKAYEELKKCIVLCANCHRIHHFNERLKEKPHLVRWGFPTGTESSV